jgi:glycosyltransferase involved in cell wall biosynthesis
MQAANYQARKIDVAASGVQVAPNLRAASTQWPRITLVTPVYNGARFIEETIRSIVYQGYPNLEYIVVDGGSSDGTVEIIKKYENHISWRVSRHDKGVYDALNNGFSHSTGDIMGWLNASDLLHTNGLFVVGSVFASLRAVEWLTGRPTRFNPNGMTVDIRTLPSWSRYRASWPAPINTFSRNRRFGAGVCGKTPAVN